MLSSSPNKNSFRDVARNRQPPFSATATEKTRVGFGRTELSLRLSCTECCALSSGHGPRDLGFQGVVRRVLLICGLPRSRSKMSRKHAEKLAKSLTHQRKISRHLRKQMDFKGKVQNKFKSRQKVCKKCEKINCGFARAHARAATHFFTLFANFLSTFELVLNFPFEIHWFSQVWVDFPLIFQWFR